MRIVFTITLLLLTQLVWAECSEQYSGLAVINEVADTDDFFEVKMLSSVIRPEEYNQWTLDYCTLTGQGSNQTVDCVGDGPSASGLSLSNANASGYPWLVLSTSNSDPEVNFNGIEIRLQDQYGDTVDYLRVYDSKKYDGSEFSSLTNDCSIETVIDDGGSEGKLTQRSPDGAGGWGLSPGQSGGGTTEGASNDGAVVTPDAVVSVNSVTVERGQVATLTVSLDEPLNVGTTVSYRTRDDSAGAGSDYVAVTSSITIPAGSTQGSIAIVTQGPQSQQSERFFVELTSVTGNVVLGSQIGVVTIMPEPVAWWRFEGNAEDQTGNGLDGSPNSDVSFPSASPAKAGSPGTCAYAKLDNRNFLFFPSTVGLISVQDANALDLDNQLTIAGWVRREESGEGYILSKPDNYQWYVDSSGRFFWLWGNSGELSTGEGVLFEGTWVHLAVTYRSDYQTLYVNGELVNDSFWDGTLPTSNDDLLFGRESFFSLLASSRFSGLVDEMRIYSEALSSAAIEQVYNAVFPCAGTGPQLADFRISYDAAGSVCEPLDVRVEALDSSGATLTNYTGRVDLSTTSNHGVWSLVDGNGVMSPQPDSSDDGQASYQFDLSDAGVATFNLSNTHADQLSIAGTDWTEGVTASGGTVEFLENILRISPNDPLGDDLIAARPHQYEVALIKRDENGECGVATNYEGTHSLEVWLNRSENDPGGAGPEIIGKTVLTEAGNEPGTGGVELEFSQGSADLVLQAPDVGEYTLRLLDSTSGYARDPDGTAIPVPSTSTGAPWTARPFALAVSAPGNPGATDADGDIFTAAGADFELEVKGVLYDSTDDANGDGRADVGAVLSDNMAAQSFGQEGETISLEADLLAPDPTAADNPGLQGGENPMASFTNGLGSAPDFRFTEVGIISVSARITDGAYLGVTPARTERMVAPSGPVGRFIPDRLDVSLEDKGTLGSACTAGTTPFTYTGQVFRWQVLPRFEVIPKAVGGEITNNYYLGGFMKLQASGFERGWPTTDDSATLNDNTTLMPLAVTFSDGVLEPRGDGDPLFYEYSAADEFLFTKTSEAQVAPFDPGLTFGLTKVSDTDNVSWTSPASATVPAPSDFRPDSMGDLRYGRLQMENVYGPENVDELLMPFSAEYWNGSRFVTNIDDSCTPWDTAKITDPQVYHSLIADSGSLAGGVGGPLVLKPNGDRGTDTLIWDMPIWLEGDWNQDGALEEPSATATFGVFRGNDRIVYWRERW